MAAPLKPLDLGMPEPDTDYLEEVIWGEIWKLPPPSSRHAELIERLDAALRSALPVERFLVRTTAYGLGIRSGDRYTARIPDLTVFDRLQYEAHMAEERERDYVWLAPGLIAECLSPSNRKSSVLQLLADYEKAGTSEVWLIYPEQRRLAVYMRRGTALEHTADVSSGLVRPKLCPADVNVDELWTAFQRR